MEFLLSIDRSLFLLINHLPHTGLLDEIALFLSGIGEYGIVWFFFGILLVYREDIKDRFFFVPLVITGFFAWISSELVLKELVMRIRPSIAVVNAIVVTWPIGFSFPSTHAFFAFSLAPILAYKEPTAKKLFYGLACVIAFSRMYLGHHYPSDVLVGGALGYVLGRSILWWYSSLEQQKIGITQKRSPVKKQRNRV